MAREILVLMAKSVIVTTVAVTVAGKKTAVC